MSTESLYINSSCNISPNTVMVKGQPVLELPGLAAHKFLEALYKHTGTDYPKFYKMDHLAKLGFLATEFLLSGNPLDPSITPEQVSLVFSNANASLDADLHYFETVKNIPSPALFVYTLPNIVMGEVSIRHRFKGENAFFVTEKFNPRLLHWYVQDLFDRKKTAACICGWVDLLDEAFNAVLFLVQRSAADQALIFDIDNIHKIHELSNGEING